MSHLRVQSIVVAVFTGMLWFPVVPGQGTAAREAPGLSALTVWQGPTFARARADFSSGVEAGLESLGAALEKALTPQVGRRIAFAPAFREDIDTYQVTVAYPVTAVSVSASARVPGTPIAMTARGPDGALLNAGAYLRGIDAVVDDEPLLADVLRAYRDLPVGRSTLIVEVGDPGARRLRPYTLHIVRREADLADASERTRFFRDTLLAGSALDLERALAAGSDVDATYAFGRQSASAIVVAALKGFEEAVRVLIPAGADLNTEMHDPENDVDGATALIMAAAFGHDAVAGLLLDAGADPDVALPGPALRPDHRMAGATALLVVIIRGHDAVADRLIDAGADVNRVLPDSLPGSDSALSGASPLMLAAFQGKAGLVRRLIAAGADLDYAVSGTGPYGPANPQTVGLTALRLATAKGHGEVADLLKAAGACAERRRRSTSEQGEPWTTG